MLTDIQKSLAALALEAISDPESAVRDTMDLAANEPMGEEDLASVKSILQPWWHSCEDARGMLRWTSMTIKKHGEFRRYFQGSPSHRRLVILCCMCARTDPTLTDRSVSSLDLIEAWAHGGEDRRDEALILSNISSAAIAYQVSRVACDGADSAAICAAYFSAISVDANCGDAFYQHLGNLADLIRGACREVPLPEPSGHDVRPTLGSTHAKV